MEISIHKNLEAIKTIALLWSDQYRCRWIIIIHNPVDGKFDPEQSTYEVVKDSYFDTERPNVVVVTDSEELAAEDSNWHKYYVGMYAKKECDIRLHDGTVIKHFYPNAGKFNKMCGDQEKVYTEEEVDEIRYPEYYLKDLCNSNCNNDDLTSIARSKVYEETTPLVFDNISKFGWTPSVHVPQYRRPEPKVQRNEPCTCGSGKKYKKCCGK